MIDLTSHRTVLLLEILYYSYYCTVHQQVFNNPAKACTRQLSELELWRNLQHYAKALVLMDWTTIRPTATVAM